MTSAAGTSVGDVGATLGVISRRTFARLNGRTRAHGCLPHGGSVLAEVKFLPGFLAQRIAQMALVATRTQVETKLMGIVAGGLRISRLFHVVEKLTDRLHVIGIEIGFLPDSALRGEEFDPQDEMRVACLEGAPAMITGDVQHRLSASWSTHPSPMGEQARWARPTTTTRSLGRISVGAQPLYPWITVFDANVKLNPEIIGWPTAHYGVCEETRSTTRFFEARLIAGADALALLIPSRPICRDG